MLLGKANSGPPIRLPPTCGTGWPCTASRTSPLAAKAARADQIQDRYNYSLPALTHSFMGSLALGLVSFGGRRRSSASLDSREFQLPSLGHAPGLLKPGGHGHAVLKRKGSGSRCPS